jgi:hypothetical protein
MREGRNHHHVHAAVGGALLEVVVRENEWLGAVGGLAASPGGPAVGRIEWGGPVPALPDGPPDFDDADGRGWTRLPVPYLVLGAAHVRLGQRTVSVTAEPGRAAEAYGRALPLALTWVLGRVDRWVVHAAAVVGPDRRVVLALGPSGAGKSTVAAAAVAAGWPVLGDDQVVVRLRPDDAGPGGDDAMSNLDGRGELEVCGVPLPLAVPKEFSDLGPAVPGDWRHRRQVDTDLAAGWWPIGRIAVLARGTEEATTAQPIRAIDAFRSVRTSHAAADVPERKAAWFSVAGRLARRPALRLALGTRAESRLATTIQALGHDRPVTASGNRPPPR